MHITDLLLIEFVLNLKFQSFLKLIYFFNFRFQIKKAEFREKQNEKKKRLIFEMIEI